MEDKKKQELLERVISLGKDSSLEIAKSIIDHYKINLKGIDYIDEFLEIGMDYDRFGDFEKALNMYHKAEKRALAIGDREGLGTIYSNIGVVHNNTKDYDQALEYYQKALEFIEEAKNDQELGILYNNMGYLYKNILKYRECVDYYIRSLTYLDKVNDKFSMTASYYNLAEVFAKLFEYETAIKYMDKCIQIDKELNLATLKEDQKYRESLVQKFEKEQGKKELEIEEQKPKEEKKWSWRRK